MPAPVRPTKITLAEMREAGVRGGLLIYCADYRCSHSIAIRTPGGPTRYLHLGHFWPVGRRVWHTDWRRVPFNVAMDHEQTIKRERYRADHARRSRDSNYKTKPTVRPRPIDFLRAN